MMAIHLFKRSPDINEWLRTFQQETEAVLLDVRTERGNMRKGIFREAFIWSWGGKRAAAASRPIPARRCTCTATAEAGARAPVKYSAGWDTQMS